MIPTKYLLLTGLLLASLFIFSTCNKNAEDEQVPDSLTVTSNQASLFDDSDASFVFTATGSDDLDYTASSEFYVNNTLLPGNTFHANTEGLYTVYAKYKSRQSNSITVEVVGRDIKLTGITISSNRTRVVEDSGNAFIFSVTGTKSDGANVDLSDLEGIKYYVNNTLINGKTFTPTEINDYTVYATFNDDLTSNRITVKCVPDPAIYAHKVLVEDFTGAWCGYCPRVLDAIEQVHAQTDKVVVAAIHRGSTNSQAGNYDPWNLPQGVTLEYDLGVPGYPTAFINRAVQWEYPENTHISQPIDMLQAGSAYGIAITSTLGGSSGNITATIHFNDDLEKAKYVVYILEDNLICDQHNYTDLYGGEAILQNFNHQNVVRASVNRILGDVIPDDQSVAENTYTVQLSASYAASDIANLKVMVILLDSNNQVANVQVAPANTTQEYEMK
jgi:thiol-disulfide isomerase/thioredoxin